MMKPIVLSKKIGSVVLIFHFFVSLQQQRLKLMMETLKRLNQMYIKMIPLTQTPNLCQKIKEVGNIPEEIKDLTFEKEEDAEKESLKESLFANASAEDNTISAKAKEYNLFSSKTLPTRKIGQNKRLLKSHQIYNGFIYY